MRSNGSSRCTTKRLPSSVSYVNPHTVNIACRDPGYRATLARAALRLADGFGIRIAARRKGVRVPGILNGSDLNAAVVRRAACRGWPVFLLGAARGFRSAPRSTSATASRRSIWPARTTIISPTRR
jgi:UDP-N-acetyl-D-mannosaminuronic acid transferase (WecB/TagA/CpsF family)